MASTTIEPAPLPLPDLPARLGPYKLERLIGEGGLSRVYFARDLHTGEEVAVKLLRRRLQGDADLRAVFEEQGEALTRVRAPYFVETLAAGDGEWGPWWAMRWVPGVPLSRLIQQGVQWGAEGLYHLIAQCCEALAALHALGVIHGDLKPDNLIYTGSPRLPLAATLTLLDPCLALPRPAQGADAARREAITDERESLGEEPAPLGAAGVASPLPAAPAQPSGAPFIFGTPSYMSPEHLRGEELTPAADLYSLGALLYELTTGVRPFPSDLKRVLHAKLHGAVSPPSAHQRPWPYPPAIEALILNLLSRQANARLQTVEEVSQIITRAQRQLAPPSSRPSLTDWAELTAPGGRTIRELLGGEPSPAEEPLPTTEVIHPHAPRALNAPHAPPPSAPRPSQPPGAAHAPPSPLPPAPAAPWLNNLLWLLLGALVSLGALWVARLLGLSL